MWANLLENSALLLGFAISLYTIYSAVDGILIRRRQRLATVRGLRTKLKYLFTLAESFAQLVGTTHKKHIKGDVRDKDPLPEEARDDVDFLLLRASHLLEFNIEWESESIGSALTEAQLEAFLGFVEKYQLYREVLTVRINHIKNFPHLAKPLAILLMPATLNLEAMKKTYNKFEDQFKKK